MSSFSHNKLQQLGVLFLFLFSFLSSLLLSHSSTGIQITWDEKRVTSQAFIYSITNHKGRFCPSFPAGMGTAGKKRALIFLQLWYLTHHRGEGWEGELEASNDAMEIWDEVSQPHRQVHMMTSFLLRNQQGFAHANVTAKPVWHTFNGFTFSLLHWTRL